MEREEDRHPFAHAVLFLCPITREGGSGTTEGAEEERRCEREGYRLLEICIFVGHTSLPR